MRSASATESAHLQRELAELSQAKAAAGILLAHLEASHASSEGALRAELQGSEFWCLGVFFAPKHPGWYPSPLLALGIRGLTLA